MEQIHSFRCSGRHRPKQRKLYSDCRRFQICLGALFRNLSQSSYATARQEQTSVKCFEASIACSQRSSVGTRRVLESHVAKARRGSRPPRDTAPCQTASLSTSADSRSGPLPVDVIRSMPRHGLSRCCAGMVVARSGVSVLSHERRLLK